MSEDSIQRELGILSTEIKHLREDADQDAIRRKAQYERIEAIERKVDKLVTAIEAQAPRIEKGEKAADQLERISTMGKGYLFGVGLASAFGGGGVALALHDKIAAFLKGI